jgi:hypothetical protein
MIAGGAAIQKANKTEKRQEYVARITHCDLSNRKITELVRIYSLIWNRMDLRIVNH